MCRSNVLQDLQFYRDVIKSQRYRWMQAKNRTEMFNLIVCNVASICSATNLIIILNPEDKISVTRGAALISLGFVYFMSLFELLNALALFTGFGVRFRHKYRLSCCDVLDIANKLVSTVQATLSSVTGFIVYLLACTKDFMRYKHYICDAYAWFGSAYFLYDLWSMYMVYLQTNDKSDSKRRVSKTDKNDIMPLSSGGTVIDDQCKTSYLSYYRQNPVLIMHHLFIPTFCLFIISYLRGDFGDCSFGILYLMEFSTPFVSLRGILSRMKLTASKVYIVNGILMVVTFFVFRLLSMLYVFLLYSRALESTYLEALTTLSTSCKIFICIVILPQLYWFYLMFFGALKMLVGGNSSRNNIRN